ncbi:MAG: EthD family reductase [Chloroflexi bacterium]|nr:MAG: EthD family reductase [Chloroflexota bacterium]
MIKLVYCITRRPGMSLEEFSRYWRDVHGPIGRRIPGLRRLVQSHPVSDPDGPSPAAFDGMAELWFDDLAALRAARRSPEWQASSEDESNFIDHTRTAIFLTVEREIPD